MTQISLGDLDDGQIARDHNGEFWICVSDGLYRNEISRNYIYPRNKGLTYDSVVTLFDPPKMTDGMQFRLVDDWHKNLPHETFVFQYTCCGWRFKIECKDYRVTIPNHYKSTDPRAGTLVGKWTCKGQIISRIQRGLLFTMHGEDKPELEIMLKGQTIIVPAQ